MNTQRTYAMLRACLLIALVCTVNGVNADDSLPAPDPALAEREAEFYRIVDLPLPDEYFIEAGSFDVLPDGRLAIGTRRGDVFFVKGAFDNPYETEFEQFATGLHEVFGLAWNGKEMIATQQCEVTRIADLDGDGVADRYATISDGWGFGGEHEFTFGSKFDGDGNTWVACCLTGSYTSENKFRGWAIKIAPDGTTTPMCSGIRSPGGIGMIDGEMFYVESQGPWNGACSLKHLRAGGFMGHPVSFTWYPEAPHLGKPPAQPTDGKDGRMHEDRKRIPELMAPAIVFPYRKTCQSASGFAIDESGGKFGPFTGQLFIAEYTLSLVMRADLEKVNGVYQGAVFPFRQGFASGLLAATFSPKGQLIVGGTSRGWPVRGREPTSIERLEWTGKTPFEVLTMRAAPDGFRLTFTEPVDPKTALDPASYRMETFTHHYWRFYGSPEIDQTRPGLEPVELSADGKSLLLRVTPLVPGHVHELHLPGVRAKSGEPLLHPVAYYTLNEVPSR